MCMFITLSVRTFYDLVDGRGNVRIKRLLFPLYLFLAVFSKGPLGLLLLLAGTVTFLFATGRGRTLWRYWGFTTWAVLAVLSAAWFLAAYLEGGSSYLHNLLFHQTVDRAVDSFHHKEPFYYYLLAYWYSFAPWSLLLAYVIVDGLRRKAALSDMQKLLLSMVCASLVVLSAVSSKIQVYLLPVFPFAVFLASSMLGGVRRGVCLRCRSPFRPWPLPWGCLLRHGARFTECRIWIMYGPCWRARRFRWAVYLQFSGSAPAAQ